MCLFSMDDSTMVDVADIVPSEENKLKELPIEARHSICLEISKKRRQKAATSIFIPKDLSSRIRFLKFFQRREKNLQISNKNAKMKHDLVTSANICKKYNKKHLKTSLKLHNQQQTNHVYLKHPESYPISNKYDQSTTSERIRSVLELLREKTGRNSATKQLEQVEQQIPLGSDQSLTISYTVEVPENTHTSMLAVAETTHNTMSAEAAQLQQHEAQQHEAQQHSSAEELISAGTLLPKQELEDLAYNSFNTNEHVNFYAEQRQDLPAYVEPMTRVFKEEPIFEQQNAEVSQPDLPTFYFDASWNNYNNKATALDAKTSEASVTSLQQPMSQNYQSNTVTHDNFPQLQHSISTSAPLTNFNQLQSSLSTTAQASNTLEATTSQCSISQHMIYLYNQQQKTQQCIQQTGVNSSCKKPATIHQLAAKNYEHYLRKQLQHLNYSLDYHLEQNLLEANKSLYATQNAERRAIRSSRAQPTNVAYKTTTNSCHCALPLINATAYPGQPLTQQQSNYAPANSQKLHSNTSEAPFACLSSSANRVPPALYDNYVDVLPETAFDLRVAAQQHIHYQTYHRQHYAHTPPQHFAEQQLEADRQQGINHQHRHTTYSQISVPNQPYIEAQHLHPSYIELPQQPLTSQQHLATQQHLTSQQHLATQQHLASQQHFAAQQHFAPHQLLETQQRLETQQPQLIPQPQRLVAQPPYFEAHTPAYEVQQQHYHLHCQQQQKQQQSHYAYNNTDISCTSHPTRLQRFSQALAHMRRTYLQPPLTDSNYWLQRQLNVLYDQRDANTLLSRHVFQ